MEEKVKGGLGKASYVLGIIASEQNRKSIPIRLNSHHIFTKTHFISLQIMTFCDIIILKIPFIPIYTDKGALYEHIFHYKSRK